MLCFWHTVCVCVCRVFLGLIRRIGRFASPVGYRVRWWFVFLSNTAFSDEIVNSNLHRDRKRLCVIVVVKRCGQCTFVVRIIIDLQSVSVSSTILTIFTLKLIFIILFVLRSNIVFAIGSHGTKKCNAFDNEFEMSSGMWHTAHKRWPEIEQRSHANMIHTTVHVHCEPGNWRTIIV